MLTLPRVGIREQQEPVRALSRACFLHVYMLALDAQPVATFQKWMELKFHTFEG